MKRKRLGVNIDHVATVRQARRGIEPEPVVAAGIVELAGADGITIHLREDRRHIQDRDVKLINEVVQTRLNLEMAATDEMFGIALEIKPEIVTLVPEKREEITTEGGLNLSYKKNFLKKMIKKLKKNGSRISLFVEPNVKDIKESTVLICLFLLTNFLNLSISFKSNLKHSSLLFLIFCKFFLFLL